MTTKTQVRQKFYVEIIKPSHYDDEGYVIQWLRAFIPSNSLACVYALTAEAKDRQVLGEDVDIVINAYDECHTVIPVKKIIRRIQQQGSSGVVFMAGVQSNQFPRAADMAREFREAGVQVVIGGFHVSGCISMLPEMPPEIQAVQDLGVTLYAGEAEGKLDELLKEAHQGKLQPVYNNLLALPDLQGQTMPFLPTEIARKSFNFTAFDVGRGCPFRCSFCTIINVQGRKSRFRDADDVEQVVRAYLKNGIKWFFITDDNMARNKNWESIFDRLIKLREEEGMQFKIFIQVDTQCHKIPNFIEKATRAGCKRVFIGMENVNPENLIAAKKYQNKISEYRIMLQKWRKHGAITYAGYILGFPADTPASIERDIKTIQRELPVDILEFFILTPLPGSADHRDLAVKKVPMETDMNVYDLEHITTAHGKMSPTELQGIYDRAWHLYYSPEHVETMIRRAEASGTGAKKLVAAILAYYGSYRFEKLHPLQGGILRRKVRTSRRPTFPRENPLVFYPRRVWEVIRTYASAGLYFLELEKIRKRVAKDPGRKQYMDLSLSPTVVVEDEAEGEACCTTEKAPGVVTLSATPVRKRTEVPVGEKAA